MCGVRPGRSGGSESQLRAMRSEIGPYMKGKAPLDGPGQPVDEIAGMSRVCLWRRASTNGALGVSSRRLANQAAGTRGRDRVTGACSDSQPGPNSSENQRREQRSGKSVGNGRRERLFDQKVIGHRRRPGLGGGWRQIVGGTGGRTLALFQEPTREHGASIFVEPLIEQGSNFLAKVSGVA